MEMQRFLALVQLSRLAEASDAVARGRGDRVGERGSVRLEGFDDLSNSANIIEEIEAESET